MPHCCVESPAGCVARASHPSSGHASSPCGTHRPLHFLSSLPLQGLLFAEVVRTAASKPLLEAQGVTGAPTLLALPAGQVQLGPVFCGVQADA